VKLTRAWHVYLDGDGAKTARDGRRLTVGIDQQGRMWLSGEAIDGQDVPIGPDVAAWLSGTLTAAILRTPEGSGAAPRPTAPGTPTCGALKPDGRWSCTAQPSHAGPEHVAFGAMGDPWERWPVTEADDYEAACAWFDRASAAAPAARAAAAALAAEADDNWAAARANLARFERSPGVPLPQHDPLRLTRPDPAGELRQTRPMPDDDGQGGRFLP
jgi:hypothetical protein